MYQELFIARDCSYLMVTSVYTLSYNGYCDATVKHMNKAFMKVFKTKLGLSQPKSHGLLWKYLHKIFNKFNSSEARGKFR